MLNFLSEENFEIRVVKIIVPIFQNHRYSYALHWFKVLWHNSTWHHGSSAGSWFNQVSYAHYMEYKNQ